MNIQCKFGKADILNCISKSNNGESLDDCSGEMGKGNEPPKEDQPNNVH